MRYDINVEDVEYSRHGGTPLLMRLYRPQGTGPFPSWSSCTVARGAARTASATS